MYFAGTKSISNPITEDVTGVSNSETPVRGELVIGISAIFILILVLLVVVLIIRFKRARDASRSKCTAPNNTKLNGDTTMTVGNSNGNPYGTIQRHSATLRRPINNGFATLEQHPHNTLRYVWDYVFSEVYQVLIRKLLGFGFWEILYCQPENLKKSFLSSWILSKKILEIDFIWFHVFFLFFLPDTILDFLTC